MGRNRVLSFMSQFSATSKTPTPSSSPPNQSPSPNHFKHDSKDLFPDHQSAYQRPATPPSRPDYGSPVDGSPRNSTSHKRTSSRPSSMLYTYQPPIMDINEDTIPELQPVFSFLNSHSNKLYQEGYFLKLDDQNTQGRPNPDRTWTECFAQLVGTVLSLWDAAELDAAGEDGEVLPKFINLTDASIKMIDKLPTRSNDEQPLQNILSISTAGRNRYLLHFNSHHSLVQWTAGIRLSMYEHSTLQEAYTGALIAGKGKTLNNINVVMERSRLKTEEWVRVRFGAGVPWRRCWCVISPPDEKEFAKAQKEMKKRSAYDRSHAPALKGTIKFYDTKTEGKKQKKMQPIATITDAYSAYAIYPQAKSLIDASTLLKIEGNVSIHSDPPSAAEGFVFIMPEVPPAVSGFEMLLRFLFPTWDTFALYGRPGRLVASVLDPRSLMFAMPKHKRYGYLEILDVSGLISTEAGAGWNEKEWRKRLKDVTGTRMNAVEDMPTHARNGSRNSARLSFGGKPKVGFADDGASTRSSRSHSLTGPPRTDSAPPDAAGDPRQPNITGTAAYQNSPQLNQLPQRPGQPDRLGPNPNYGANDGRGLSPAPVHELDSMRSMRTPEPVSRPPAFNHASQARPTSKVYHSPELRRANSRLSSTTLAQIAQAGGVNLSDGHPSDDASARREGEPGFTYGPSVHLHANPVGTYTDNDRSREALSPPNQNRPAGGPPPPLNLSAQQHGRPPMGQAPYGPPSPYSPGPNSPARPPGSSDGRNSPYPPGGNPRGRGGPPPGRGRGAPRPPPHAGQDQYGGPNGGPASRGYPGRGGRGGGPGRGGRGGPPPGANQYRKPVPDMNGGPFDKHTSVTPNDIIDHYTSDPRGPPPYQRPPPNYEREQRPPPPPHGANSYGEQGNPYGDFSPDMGQDDGRASLERPRAGVMKTVAGGERPMKTVAGGERPMQPPSQFGIPEVNFGPTINYGASSIPRKQMGGQGQGQAPRPYSPAGQRPNFDGRNSPSGYPSHERQDSQTMAWHPAQASGGPNAQGLSPEQYVQHRAAAPSPQYIHQQDHGRGPSPQPMDPRFAPSQGQYPSRPGTAQGQNNAHPQFQGQAF